MKMLLVDDSGTMRTIQKRQILQLGIPEENIVEADNGQTALQAFEANHFDLILTDWNMPVMDGLQFLKEVRQRDTKIPVIMVTTEAERGRVVAAIEAGVSDYLTKPFSPDTLQEKLRKWAPAFV